MCLFRHVGGKDDVKADVRGQESHFILLQVSESIKSLTQVQKQFGIKRRTEHNSSVQHRVPFQKFEEVLYQIGKFVTKLHPHLHIPPPQ